MAKALTLQELQGLMGFADPETSTKVARKVEETLTVFRTKLNLDNEPTKTIKMPQIVYDLKGHTAGQAVGGHTIRLNLDLLNTEPVEMYERIIPHEVAHIVVQQLWPNKPGGHHGYRWQAMMFMLGLEPTRTHSLATKAARKPRSKNNMTYCNCTPSEHPVTDTIYRRFLKGTKYTCRRCGAHLRKQP